MSVRLLYPPSGQPDIFAERKEDAEPDDRNKRGKQDRARVSKQEHEQRYQAEKRKAARTNSESVRKEEKLAWVTMARVKTRKGLFVLRSR